MSAINSGPKLVRFLANTSRMVQLTGKLLALASLLLITACGGSSFSGDRDPAPNGNGNSQPSSGGVSAQNGGEGPIQRSEPLTVITDNSEQAVDIEISWNAPTTREDGSELRFSELGGYEIESENLETRERNNYTVENGSQSSLVVRELSPGTYRFFLFSFDTNNRLSLPTLLPDVIVEAPPTS